MLEQCVLAHPNTHAARRIAARKPCLVVQVFGGLEGPRDHVAAVDDTAAVVVDLRQNHDTMDQTCHVQCSVGTIRTPGSAHGHHPRGGERKVLVNGRAYPVVHGSDTVAPHDAGKLEVNLIKRTLTGGAHDDGSGGFRGHVVTEVGAQTAGDGDHADVGRCPFVKVRLVLDDV